MSRYYRPDGTRYRNRYPLHEQQRGCLPLGCAEGCVSLLLPVVIVLAVVLFVALNFHPQGFPLIPWLIDHL